MYKTLEELNSYMSKVQAKDPKQFDEELGTIQQRAKDKSVFLSSLDGIVLEVTPL